MVDDPKPLKLTRDRGRRKGGGMSFTTPGRPANGTPTAFLVQVMIKSEPM